MIHRPCNIKPGSTLVLLAGALLVLSGCASSSSISSSANNERRIEPIQHDDTHTRLVMSMSGWLDTPYVYGGNLKSGVDCSAYVQALTDKAFGVRLPRTTVEQMKVGREVSRAGLQPGDLVFFKTGRNQYHVGIYLESGEFTHASTSSGVTVSHLNDYYWRDKYLTARRVLEDSIEELPIATGQLLADRPGAERTERPRGADPDPGYEPRSPETQRTEPAQRTGRGSGTWTTSGKTKNTGNTRRTGW